MSSSFWGALEKGSLQVLKTVAPTIAGVAAGPFGSIAEPIVAALCGDTPAAVNKTLQNATPEQLMQLKQADADLKVKLAQLGIQEEQLAYSDVDSARKMQMTTKDAIPGQLAWLAVGGFVVMCVTMVVLYTAFPEQTAKIPSAAWSQIGALTGLLGATAKAAVGFYFGSSQGSQGKDATIAQLSNTQAKL